MYFVIRMNIVPAHLFPGFMDSLLYLVSLVIMKYKLSWHLIVYR